MPRFSIVITTCDRPNLLQASIRAALAVNFSDFELVVSDNFSKVPASQLLEPFTDARIRQLRTDRRMPAPDHWEFVWNHIRGEYVIFLGDDNALHPDILSLADRFIDRHDPDVLAWRNCLYYHPDWNIRFGSLPARGNILAFDAGTTGGLYECHQAEVLKSYCQQLRLLGCFPCMHNIVFRKSNADMVRQRMGRFFWAPNPDISASYLAVGAARPGRYIFFDAFGSLGGWSRDSNLATLLSGGKNSRKAYDYLAEFGDQDLMPRHDFKFIAPANALAATARQARTLMPDYFGDYDYDLEELARRTIENMYVEKCVPWVDDPNFLNQVEKLFAALPVDVRSGVLAYRDQCLQERQAEAAAPDAQPNDPDETPRADNWLIGNTTYVDMQSFGAHDIADVARHLTRVLHRYDRFGDEFIAPNRKAGFIGRELSVDSGLSQLVTPRFYQALSRLDRLELVIAEEIAKARMLEVRVTDQLSHITALEKRLDEVYASRSWRLTSHLRKTSWALRGLLGLR